MSTEWIIGVLAFATIGAVMFVAIAHFRSQLKNPRNKEAAANITQGGKAASTQVAEDAPDGSFHDRTLKQRLDDSPSSRHPHDPEPGSRGIS